MDRQRVPRLSLDLLRGFRAAARHLSFTRAAQELFVTQPAVSREIRTLEEQLGTPLFRRVNRALQLTQAGQELYAAVDEALSLIDAATTRLAGASRSLSVTTTVALASTWLVPRLPGFTRLHPQIDMRLLASNDWIDLAREHIEIAIRYVPPAPRRTRATSCPTTSSFRSARPRWPAIPSGRCASLPIWPATCCSTSRRCCTAGPGTTGASGWAR